MYRSVTFAIICTLINQATPVTIPHLKDEVKLVQIKASPDKYLTTGTTSFSETDGVIICGGIQVGDYYNYGYYKAERSFYNLDFREVGETSADLGQRAHLYLSKPDGEQIVEAIVARAKELKNPNHLVLARVRVSLHFGRYAEEKKWDMLEVHDVQICSENRKDWGPWINLAIHKKNLEEAKKRLELQKAVAKKAEMERLEKDKAESLNKAKLEAAKFREFKIDGKAVKAKYSGIISGVVKLETEDGKTIKVPLSDLTKEEQAWIKEKKWLKPVDSDEEPESQKPIKK